MYISYLITSTTELNILIAFLADLGFDSFEETANGLAAYRLASEHEQAVNDLANLSLQFPLTYTFETLPNKNWNEEWESQFSPIRVGDKLGIRASFHEPIEGVQEELIIDPKMAFGTGHHATTHMVCDLMFAVDFTDQTVLDYGSGTGVLAILGKRLGAGFTWAVDIEPPSYENTLENASTNGVQLEKVSLGTLETVDSGQKFDIVLANINRNVILDSLASLYERLTPSGLLFISGILHQDAQLVEETAIATGFTLHTKQEKDGWYAWVFNR